MVSSIKNLMIFQSSSHGVQSRRMDEGHVVHFLERSAVVNEGYNSSPKVEGLQFIPQEQDTTRVWEY